MIKEIYFEDYVPGDTRETLGRTITETDIVVHAGQTGDFFPHHMDAEWCKTQDFKQRIAHGTLIFSVAVGMTANLINPVAQKILSIDPARQRMSAWPALTMVRILKSDSTRVS